MAEKDDDLEQLRYLRNLYAQEYDALLNEISTQTVAENAVASNIEVLENFDTISNSKMLLNLEAGTYMEVMSKDVKSIITYVGSGYLIEKNLEEAKLFLNKNRERNEEALKLLFSQAQKLEKELIDLGYKVDMMQQQG